MVSDSQLIERLREFLGTADLSTTTTAIVRKRLEEEFQVDLTNKKAFIREQVDLYLQSQQENDKDDVEEDEEVDDGDGEGQGDGGPEDAASGSGEGEDDGDDEEEEEEEEEAEGDDEGAGGSRKRPEKKRGGGGGFTKLCGLSPELQKIIGVSKLPRTKVVQQLWVYIRKHDLQDPENRRNIRCDKLLRSVFNSDSINMFQMNKVLSKHIYPLPPGDNGEVESNEKPLKMEKGKEKDDLKPKAKRPKKEKGEVGKGNTHLSAPLPLSNALVKFIGTGEDALSRGEVIKRIWAYIKENELQDPADKRQIICDEKLKELFEVDSFTGFTVTKLLSAHFVKAEQ
ncbi:upstream activation factor subunit spp27-like isoform X2 [Nymphaea colorata]|uniref:upstream activation factor subunit spp27-like isoform X2 n=1 Tax=Nymphaea colorata TaxID=210225 RepID=UPI00129D3908|nr:upstream activation factor subunit spp27-like isoform X2 [Nymphaea colorata]